MSHSIHMLSIQINTELLELIVDHQIVLFCQPYERKFSTIDDIRLLGTLLCLVNFELRCLDNKVKMIDLGLIELKRLQFQGLENEKPFL